MRKITVNTSTKYDIFICENFENFSKNINSLFVGEKVAIITDTNVDKFYCNFLSPYLSGKKVYKYVINAGEKSKNAKNYIDILEKMADDGFSRQDSVITFGGGVIGDLGAFIASTYMRGITLVSIPTTLLSMVDSSVGGKTAINLSKGKNLCGTFYQPKAVYINLQFLSTLPKKQIISGLGEIVKYTYLSDTLSNFNGKIDENLIYETLKIKKDIVDIDEKENNLRKLLNFGHTIGHAIEKLYNFRVSHGLCVAKGIKYALSISEKYYKIDGLVNKYQKLAKKLKLNLQCPFTNDEIIDNIYNDKKRKGDKIDFILIDSNKKPQIVAISIDKINNLL